MSRQKNYKAKIICAFMLMLSGIVLLAIWLPCWVWFVLIGIVLIVLGINIYYKY
ncbi:MAG: hypothetical protein N2448_04865 [Caloramator sp.]|nr:hypothetical protein [Caloramator sp.]